MQIFKLCNESGKASYSITTHLHIENKIETKNKTTRPIYAWYKSSLRVSGN